MGIVSKCSVLLGLAVLLPLSDAHGQPDRSALAAQLQRAGDLERAGQFEEALRLYRHLDAVYPGNDQVHQGLRSNLERLGRYAELVPLLEQTIRRRPDALDLRISLGRALYKTGQRDAAHRQWRAVIDQAPDRPSTYVMVAQELSRTRQVEEAIALYQEGRDRLSVPDLFAIELARLYTWQMSYADAVRELLAHLEQHPDEYGTVESYLYEFPVDGNVVAAVTDVLAEAAHSDTTDIDKRKLLGNYHLAVGQPDSALAEVLWIALYQDAHDKDRFGEGRALLEFALRGQQENQCDTALRSYAALLETFPGSPYLARAMLGTGQCLEHLQRHDEAIAHYQTLQKIFAGAPQSYEAAYRIGRIQLAVKHDSEAALATFEHLVKVAGERRDADVRYRALLGVGDALLLKGALEEARSTYAKVAPVRDRLAHAEVASFRMAELDYYTGSLDQALKGFETVALRFPKGDLVNDALSMIMRIEEVPEASLKHFARAEYLGRQGRFDEAIALVEGWLGEDEHAREDEPLAMLLLSDLREGSGDYEGAIRACQELIAEHGSSPLCPEAQERIGTLYEHRIKDLDAAIGQYVLVLANYPGSLLTDEVRRAVRRLVKGR